MASALFFAAFATVIPPAALAAVGDPQIIARDVVVGEGDGFVDVVIGLSAPGTTALTVAYQTASNTAFASTNDFIPISGSLTFTPGQTSKPLRVQIINDTIPEPQESLSLQIISGGVLAAQSAITIVDNDTIVTAPRLFVGDTTVDEKDGTATVPVTMGWPSGEASISVVTVQYATSNATAIAGSDYSATSGTLTFARGENVKNIPVTITDDNTAEPAERINIVLTAPIGGATLQDPNGVIVITPNDAPAIANPQIVIRDTVVGEGDGYVDLVVGLSAPGTAPLTVGYQTVGNTAFGLSSTPDYFSISGSLTFTPGQTSKTLRLHIINDTLAEPQESLSLQIGNGISLVAQSTITIVDNDTVVTAPRLFVGDSTLDEKDGTATVPVTMGWPNGEASNSVVTVHYATSNNTAAAGSDYTATSGTLTFARGENVKNIPVTITDDTTAEPAERINITLTAPTGGATLQDPNGVIVITPNDATAIANPQIVIRDTVVGEGDGYVDLVVGLSAPRSTPLTVGYQTVANTAFGLSSTPDYISISGTLTFAPGQTSKTLRLQIINDAAAEPQESLFLQIISANILAAQSAITIVDNDNGRRVLSLGISNDVYSVTAANDIIVENPSGGTDRVQSSVTYTLPANVENLTLTGAGAINGTGNTAANQLVGNVAANTLSGLAGNDVLTGGAGADTITGGTGADTIVLTSTTGSDTISDFNTVDDTFRISMAGISIGNGDTVVNGGVTRAAPGGFASAAELVIFTANITGAITTTNAAAKIGSATTAYTAGDNRLFVVDNGTETDIFRFRSSAADPIVSAAELTLVGKVHYTAPTTATALSDYTFGV